MLRFDNTYARLPSIFYEKIDRVNNFKPRMLAFNQDFALELGLDVNSINENQLLNYFCANQYFPNSEPLAMVYAGHQFGHFSPQLGDGRALLLGEFIGTDKTRYDLHLKGSGRTKFSRGGDGLSALGPVVREYLMSECFHALGIPTTRSLCALRTGEEVYRDEIKPGGILVRVAKSHLRIGTFEYFASRRDWTNLKILADYAISRLYPELKNQSEDYFSFWKMVASKQVKLVAQWMSVGFIHGVMNTDNINISGETIDFGPCAFMDEFKKDKVFSSIDKFGRYRYNNQASILFWNLARFAESLIPIMSGGSDVLLTQFTQALEALPNQFEHEYRIVMMKKFGISEIQMDDKSLIQMWLDFLESNELDFTLSFIDLKRIYLGEKSFTNLETYSGFDLFYEKWNLRFQSQNNIDQSLNLMDQVNPTTIARNHQVQKAIESCEAGQTDLFIDFLKEIKRPYQHVIELGEYQLPPRPDQRVTKTFCGT